MSKVDTTWLEVIKMNPKGDIEIHGGNCIMRGPMHKILMTRSGRIEVQAEWMAKKELNGHGKPAGPWTCVVGELSIITRFRPETVPVAVDGRRVLYDESNVIYLDEAGRLNPKEVNKLILKQK